MKSKTFFYLCLYSTSILFLFTNVINAVAEWRIEYSDSLINQMRKQGQSLPKYSGHYRTKPECIAAINAISTQGFNVYGNEAKCVEFPDNYAGGGSIALPFADLTTEAGCQAFMTGMMINMIFDALNSSPQSDPAEQQRVIEQQRAAAAKKKKEDMAERMRRLKAWNENIQNRNCGNIFGDSNGSSADSGSLDGLFSIPSVEFKPRGTANYDTSALSLVDRLRCATYFSNKATEAAANGDHVHARYLNEQAQKAMSGQIVDEPVQFAAFSDMPEIPPPERIANPEKLVEYESIIKSVQLDIKKLQDIDTKLKETDDKIEQAEEKKHQAEQEIAEFENRAGVTSTPEEKQEIDDLYAQAQALLQEAEGELKEATDNKENYSNEKERITEKLKEMQKSIQNPPNSD